MNDSNERKFASFIAELGISNGEEKLHDQWGVVEYIKTHPVEEGGEFLVDIFNRLMSDHERLTDNDKDSVSRIKHSADLFDWVDCQIKKTSGQHTLTEEEVINIGDDLAAVNWYYWEFLNLGHQFSRSIDFDTEVTCDAILVNRILKNIQQDQCKPVLKIVPKRELGNTYREVMLDKKRSEEPDSETIFSGSDTEKDMGLSERRFADTSGTNVAKDISVWKQQLHDMRRAGM